MRPVTSIIVSQRTRALLTSPFAFCNPALFHARVRLYADHLELTGWNLRGCYRRRITTVQVLQVDVMEDDGLLLWLSTGETLRLHIHDARRWKSAIETQTELRRQG